jgi:uncharacterized tellurite resistance protein B-like protein
MMNRIRSFFHDRILSPAGRATPADARRLATAALLVEVMLCDRRLDETEIERIPELLGRRFGLTPGEARELVELARQEVEQATSLYQFTALVNEHFPPEDKYHLVRNLWEVAYADAALDKHEEALIRHVAELIHLPHVRFIQARNAARDQLGAGAQPRSGPARD